MIEHNSGAQDVPVQRDQVRLEGLDEETGLVPVDVQTVALQQLLLVSPALRPVLRQLLDLRRWRESVKREQRARPRASPRCYLKLVLQHDVGQVPIPFVA